MTRTRQWITIGFVAALVVAVAGWFLAVAPQRSHAASLRSQTSDTVQSNATLQSRLQQLKSQVANVAAEEARIAAIQSKLPAQPEMASYIRALTGAAAASHVDLLSIAPGTPTAVASPTSAAQPAAPAPTAAAGSSAAKGSGTTTAGSTAGGSQSAQTAGRPEALQTIAVNLTINGDYFAIRNFLAQLEKLPRVTLVTSLNLAPGAPLQPQGATASSGSAEWKTLQSSLSLSIFMAAAPQAVQANPAPGAPAAPTSTAAASN